MEKPSDFPWVVEYIGFEGIPEVTYEPETRVGHFGANREGGIMRFPTELAAWQSVVGDCDAHIQTARGIRQVAAKRVRRLKHKGPQT